MAEKDYGSVEYWEKRYHDSGKDALFDWYFDYKSVENSIVNYLGDARKSGLILGCGNSDWGEYMVRDGYKHVVNIDFSPTVIRYMSHRYRNNSKLEYRVMDVNDLSEIKDGSMDIVVDKGLLDTVICSIGFLRTVRNMLRQVQRILRPETGRYLMFTHATQDIRKQYLEEEGLKWKVVKVSTGAPSMYTAFLMLNKTEATDEMEEIVHQDEKAKNSA